MTATKKKSKKDKVTRGSKKTFPQKVSDGVLDLIGPTPVEPKKEPEEKEVSVPLPTPTKAEKKKTFVKKVEVEKKEVAKKIPRVPYPIRCREDIIDAFDLLFVKQKVKRRKLKKVELIEEALVMILEKYNDEEALALIHQDVNL